MRESHAACPHTSPVSLSSPLTINELLLAYFHYAAGYYVGPGGKRTKEYDEMRYAAQPVRLLYGSTLVRDFGPKSLQLVRQHLVDTGRLCRQVINRRINRVRRIFRWAVSEELAPPGVWEALRAVPALQYGRTTAREADPVRPVPAAWIDPVLATVSPQVRAMIQVQQLGGM